MEHLINDHEDRPNQYENSHKLCDKKGHLVVILMKIQWKTRQQHDQIKDISAMDNYKEIR